MQLNLPIIATPEAKTGSTSLDDEKWSAKLSEVFRNAGWSPARLIGAESAICEVERRIGKSLPRSFRQFLGFANWVEFLRVHSNCDWPIPNAKLSETGSYWESYDPLNDNLLPFMSENQGVCTWAIQLGQIEDSKIFVEVDSGSPPEWKLAANSFSDWLICQIEDHTLMEQASFAAQAPPLTPAALELLRYRFNEGNQTFAWPGQVNYRFSNDHSRILLWDGEGQCDWWICIRPDVSAYDALADMNNIVGLADALYTLRKK